MSKKSVALICLMFAISGVFASQLYGEAKSETDAIQQKKEIRRAPLIEQRVRPGMPIRDCKRTPALVAEVLPDIYCCAESDQDARLKCLTNNASYFSRLNAFLRNKILSRLPAAASEGPAEAAETTTPSGLTCSDVEAIGLETTAPTAEQIGLQVSLIDCGIIFFTERNSLISTRIESNCR